jgi:hypothetical protein
MVIDFTRIGFGKRRTLKSARSILREATTKSCFDGVSYDRGWVETVVPSVG